MTPRAIPELVTPEADRPEVMTSEVETSKVDTPEKESPAVTASPLEIRYRRLLQAYPADHRESHGEEMLGVLMASAHPDQQRPGLADTADLLRGALVLRLRRSVSHYRRREWSDGLALVSLLAPLVLLAQAASYGSWLLLGIFGPGDVRLGHDLTWQNDLYTAPIWTACGLLGLAALLGMGRSAAVLAFGAAALTFTSPFWSAAFFENTYWWWSGPSTVVILLALLSGLASVFSGGPRRAREVLGRRGLAVAVVLSLSALTTPDLGVLLPDTAYSRVLEVAPMLMTAFVAPAWLLLTAAGRRAFIVFLVGFSPLFSDYEVFYTESILGSVITAIIVMPTLTVVALYAGRLIVRAMTRRGATARYAGDRDQDGTPLTPA